MGIKANLLITFLVFVVGLLGFMAYSANAKYNTIKDYATQLESVNDSLLTTTVELDGEIVELQSINAKQLLEKDELTKSLEEANLMIEDLMAITVTIDDGVVEGVAEVIQGDMPITQDPGTAEDSPKPVVIYRIEQSTENYSLSGQLATPSGHYSIKVTQKPFGLEIREVVTPTGRKRAVARVTGRTDLNISNIDFQSVEAHGKDKDLWAIGPAVIVSDSGFDWGASVRRDRWGIAATLNSAALTFDVIRF